MQDAEPLPRPLSDLEDRRYPGQRASATPTKSPGTDPDVAWICSRLPIKPRPDNLVED